MLWEEGRAPSFVIEVTSLHTRDEDQKDKKRLYERLGVEEYFLHDPFGEYLSPVLQGYRLVEGRYRPLSPSPDGSLISNVTGLRLRPEGQRLRLSDLATGEPLLWEEEVREQARTQEARADRAEDALRATEEELVRLRRELEGRNSG